MNAVRGLATALALAMGVAAAGVTNATAADLGGGPPPVQYGSGFYAAQSNWSGFYAGVQLGGGVVDNDGLIGGGTLGYNIQAGQLVWGLETDFSGADISGPVGVDWLWTLRGRVGIPLSGSILPYVTAGLAVGDVNAGFNGFSATETNAGWTVGGGLEIKLAENWTVKGEYLYVDLGEVDVPGGLGTTIFPADDIHIVRAGINLKF